MKVIVTGSTGTIGGAVLKHCIENPSVTSVVSLTRRPLDITHPKLKNIIQTDFTKYDNDVLEQLKGAEACIWALGSPHSGKEVHVGYPLTALKAFQASVLPSLKEGQKFRFIYTSGGAVPYLDSPLLFFLGPVRKVRGVFDNDLLTMEGPKAWESFVVRPWFVVEKAPAISYVWANSYIFKPELGAAMVDIALNGGDEHLVNNAELRTKGQRALSKEK